MHCTSVFSSFPLTLLLPTYIVSHTLISLFGAFQSLRWSLYHHMQKLVAPSIMTMNCNVNATTAGGPNANAPRDTEIELHIDPEYSCSNINDAGTEDANRATFIGRNRGKLSLLVITAVLLLHANATSNSSAFTDNKVKVARRLDCVGGSKGRKLSKGSKSNCDCDGISKTRKLRADCSKASKGGIGRGTKSR